MTTQSVKVFTHLIKKKKACLCSAFHPEQTLKYHQGQSAFRENQVHTTSHVTDTIDTVD